MLVIKKSQIEHFIAEDDTQLIRVITEIVREAFFDGVGAYSDETLKSMVRIGMDRAKSYGFERAEDIASFVAVMFEISPDFDSQEQIRPILEDSGIALESRFEHLFGRVEAHAWIEAEQTYDPKTWFPDEPAAGE